MLFAAFSIQVVIVWRGLVALIMFAYLYYSRLVEKRNIKQQKVLAKSNCVLQ